MFVKHTSFVVNGTGNSVHIEKGLTRLTNCKITICGNNNTIEIGARCKMKDVSLYIEDSNGKIQIGGKTTITGKTHLAVIEGTYIRIGENCLFS